MTWLVGTSGWQYRDWRGPLYPEGVPQRLWLETYAAEFATVESNNAFYRLPSPESFAAWRDRTPPGFVMAVKASRFLTHIKRLADPEEPVARLMGAASELKDKLGPILLQLPPTLKADPGRLDRCLSCFPAHVRVAVEPRHPSWWSEEVRAILTARSAALCWADRRSRPTGPLWRTAGWGYVRLHEGRAGFEYGERALRTWAGRIREAGWPDACIYFNNDPGGAAVRNARRFATLL
ncbi:DUF72 domain-containing protein [Nonomuraea fuscirosea]|jgi:uncharacterized protein YecE (DUF72 family)|uniref:DUF72 domain-containing protein n=1 Tax=Nonomuraea fuscirosea TaxID=1291556 RepID=UPI002DDA954B|nr:DUF72 domain-containing protein [Nonomuraea fuscirosea]WSA58102.1 DUF72 domain-containing protein [Nonomuraea fuscirosea]